MNLLNDPWLKIRLRDGQVILAKPSDAANPEACDIVAPRPDFRGALYQLLIGLLQTTFAPEDEDEWYERWQAAPAPEQLQAKFSLWAHAFELESAGPAFMQDFESNDQFSLRGIGELLIDRGSEVNQYFNKLGSESGLCSACTAAALFAFQANAPEGGSGHLVSLRGGGPLTTLVVPLDDEVARVPLWQRLWLNVLSENSIEQPGGRFLGNAQCDKLPWLAATRCAKDKGSHTFPEHAHALQVYWGMPRRIRLDLENRSAGTCGVCGTAAAQLLTRFKMKTKGVKYVGWIHPLSPYTYKEKELPNSWKRHKGGGIGYQHWLGLTLGNQDRQPDPAAVVRNYVQHRANRISEYFELRVWAFGYDMDSMKARCWYDATLPIHRVSENSRAEFALAVQSLLNVAIETSRLLSWNVRAAWSKRPADLRNEPAIALSFWQATEADFYRSIAALATRGGLETTPLATLQRGWLTNTRHAALDLFDDWVSSEYAKDWDIERAVQAKSKLSKELGSAKPMKELWKSVGRSLKEAA